MYVYLIIYMLRFLACSYRCEDSLAVVGRHFLHGILPWFALFHSGRLRLKEYSSGHFFFFALSSIARYTVLFRYDPMSRQFIQPGKKQL